MNHFFRHYLQWCLFYFLDKFPGIGYIGYMDSERSNSFLLCLFFTTYAHYNFMKKFINGMPANTPEEIEKAVDDALMGGRFVVITAEIPGVNVPHVPTIDLRSNTK